MTDHDTLRAIAAEIARENRAAAEAARQQRYQRALRKRRLTLALKRPAYRRLQEQPE